MVNINTAKIRQDADILQKEARQYGHRFDALAGTMSWLRRQEFDEADELHRVLKRQYEELESERKSLMMLSEVLSRISDKYENTEEDLVESGEIMHGSRLYVVQMFDLRYLTQNLCEMGFRMPD